MYSVKQIDSYILKKGFPEQHHLPWESLLFLSSINPAYRAVRSGFSLSIQPLICSAVSVFRSSC